MLECLPALKNRPAAVTAAADDFAGRRIHMIGIGGCGMSAAAALLLSRAAIISGSDQKPFETAEQLAAAGAALHVGHAESYLPDEADLVVISAAIPESNPELASARRRGIPVLRYAELLGRIMDDFRGIAVSGTHGKSTTTALVAHIFRVAGLDPSFIVGARSHQLGGSSAAGAGEHFIVEACEYARSFLELRPHAAAILNVEADHLDCFRDLDDIQAAFEAFGCNVQHGGLLLTSLQDRALAAAAVERGVEHQTFAISGETEGNGADWSASNLRAVQGCYAFDVLLAGRRLFGRRPIKLALAGEHNVGNALAAIALAHHEGVEPDAIRRGVESFVGVDRRMSLCGAGEGRGITVLDDYAHHPTEIRVTLGAIRDRYQPKRLWAIFQPHQASRTRHLMNEFAGSFGAADLVIVADIYCVRDSEIDRREINASTLAGLIHDRGGDARHIGKLADVMGYVEEHATAGDLVVTMGAGDVWKVAHDLAERFRRAG